MLKFLFAFVLNTGNTPTDFAIPLLIVYLFAHLIEAHTGCFIEGDRRPWTVRRRFSTPTCHLGGWGGHVTEKLAGNHKQPTNPNNGINGHSIKVIQLPLSTIHLVGFKGRNMPFNVSFLLWYSE